MRRQSHLLTPVAGSFRARCERSLWCRQGPLLLGAVLRFGLSTLVFGRSTSCWLALPMLAMNGAADTLRMVVRGTIRNLEPPDEVRGRMVAVTMRCFAGGPQLGEIEAGVAARRLGTPISVAAGGLACILMAGGVAAATPALRRYTDGSQLRRPEPEGAPQAVDACFRAGDLPGSDQRRRRWTRESRL